MRVITFKVNEELLRDLDLFAANNKLYRSEVIREAIKLYLSIKKNSIEGNLRNRTVARGL
ncbi:ribbon-helix-helix protein, CopG family [Sulfolobus acidocaldarius]|uniref:ribbon-helix-helix protein, CopG family n=1 Tax=Sulfolobus acidocaldarius TaxID=2285 RepID=UPI000B5A574C|nr:ribbon-helix-helix protein, CopG family [Sulfolobus acidocaldarius]